MKNLIVSIATMLAAGLAPALASGTNADPRAEKAFAKQFAGAGNVKWTKLNEGYLMASFTLSGTRVEAFYNRDAEFVGAVRNLFYAQLPLAVMQTVEKKFAAAVIIEVKEITNTEGISYRVIFEQKDKKYNLKLNSRGGIMGLQKEKIKK